MILCARLSRAPKTLRAVGAVVRMQGIAATIFGPDRPRAILEWETLHGTVILPAGAAVALVGWGFIAFAVTGHRPRHPLR